MIMHFINRLLFIPICCIVSTNIFCQTQPFQPARIDASALKNDFIEMRDSLEKIHAGLYRYKNKVVMDNIFDSCYHSIKDSMTVTNFYALTSFVIASIEDGHTNCRLSRDFMNDYVNNAKVFPAMVMFIHNRAYILCSKQNDSLAESELLSIDNKPMQEIIQRLFNYIQSDAGIESHKNWELPEYFQILYYTLYGEKDNFIITYKTKTGNIQTTALHADIIKNIICAHPFTRPDKY